MRLAWICLVSFMLAGCSSANRTGTLDHLAETKWEAVSLEYDGKTETLPAGKSTLTFDAKNGFVWTKGTERMSGSYEFGPGATVVLSLDGEAVGGKTQIVKITTADDALTMVDTTGKIVFKLIDKPQPKK